MSSKTFVFSGQRLNKIIRLLPVGIAADISILLYLALLVKVYRPLGSYWPFVPLFNFTNATSFISLVAIQ